MNLRSLVTRASQGLVLVAVFVNGYAAGLPDSWASCVTPECKEITLVMGLADLKTAPPTKVNSSDVYDETQAIVLYAPDPHGGKVIDHATLKNQKRTECSYWWGMLCSAIQTDGLYETKIWKAPLIPTCQPKAEVSRDFCANDKDEGIENSWHETKPRTDE